jgi:hypothetical protein
MAAGSRGDSGLGALTQGYQPLTRMQEKASNTHVMMVLTS